jgi:hypothetical protein
MLCGNPPNLAPAEALTVMCWIKTKQNSVGHEPVSILRHDGHFTALQVSLEGNLHVVTWSSGHINVVAFPWRGVWDDDRWHHYAVTYHHGDGIRIYKDGVLQGQKAKPTGLLPSITSSPFIIGASELNAEYFVGSLDEVRVYDRQLSAAEIQSLYAWSAK